MKFVIFASALVLLALFNHNPAHAQHSKAHSIAVESAWSRAPAPSKRVGVVNQEHHKNGVEPDELISASTEISEKAEFHTHRMDGDVVRMRPVSAIEVAPGTPTVLRPGGHHIMLIDLRRTLKKGETFPVKLQFKNAGEIVVNVTVQSASARSMEGQGGNKHDGHQQHGTGMKMTN